MEHSLMRALIVEDDSSWRQVLLEMLTDLGLKVDVAVDLDSAVEIIRKMPHRLAVIDLSLDQADHRNQDGLKVLDAIHQHDPVCVAVLLTGYATVEIAVSAMTENRAMTCVRKERFIRSEFRSLVSQALSSPSPWLVSSHELDAGLQRRDSGVLHTRDGDEETVGLALVVEDDGGWRSLLAELLAEAGYETRMCSSYGDALGHLGRERYDLAVADLSLTQRVAFGGIVPEVPTGDIKQLDGYHLLASARANGIPVIVVSGIASPTSIEYIYREYGIFSYLEKQTFNRYAFLQTVNEIQEQSPDNGRLGTLTDRERQVLSLLATGMTNQQIAERLMISTNTVKRHLKALYAKLEVPNRAAAVVEALSAGLNSY